MPTNGFTPQNDGMQQQINVRPPKSKPVVMPAPVPALPPPDMTAIINALRGGK